MATPSRTRVDDLATLRALAHPLRTALLGALRSDGPATASGLGRRFDETSGSTSYHLRQLARYGFVEEAPEQPSRRERVWRATAELTSWDPEDFLDDPAGRSALRVLDRARIGREAEALQGWYAERAGWPREWVAAAQDSDAELVLTAAELAELGEALWEVVEERLRRPRPAAGTPGTERVGVVVRAFPVRRLSGEAGSS